MESHQERVVTEKKELDEKIMKLDIFIKKSKTFETLPEDDKDLLERQLTVMEDYTDILQHRIERFNQ